MPNGSVAENTVNTIAENIYSQIDSEGRQFVIMSKIVDHKKDLSAIVNTKASILHVMATKSRGRP